ncbi:hypothetical protein WMY93_004024 [Mugilogobius chulae]|uniref:F-box domain-containing protein n=1 Tax=Mugilogobius chulae TaxID=88201 RepID=A0AAW0PQ35_9GOBI
MLCFIIHSSNSDPDEESEHYKAGVNNSGCHHNSILQLAFPGGLFQVPVVSTRTSSFRRPGQKLVISCPCKLIPQPVVFRTAGVSVTVPIPVPVPVCTSDYTDMVCKRKCSNVQRCTPCKQPRCAFSDPDGGLENGAESSSNEPSGCQVPLCPDTSAASSSSSSSSVTPTEGCCGLGHPADVPHSSNVSPCCNHHHDDNHPKASEATEHLTINQLPSSILLKVLSHLTVKERCLCASLVCKYWRDLCLDFQFWKQIDLSGLHRHNVTEINISDCRRVHDSGVSTLASHCPGLQKYTAYRCKQLGDASLSSLATHCPLLVKVHVGNQDKLTDEALKKLGEHCGELKDIHLGQCYSITDEGMEALAKGCPKLQRLYLQENKLLCPRPNQPRATVNPHTVFFLLAAPLALTWPVLGELLSYRSDTQPAPVSP